MFALLVSGSPLSLAFVQQDPTHFTHPLPVQCNHIAVILTQPLPAGFAVTVHFGATEFRYLGFLSNEKPSAIYKLSGVTDGYSIGLAIEPVDQIPKSVAVVKQESSQLQSILQNLYDFVMSFEVGGNIPVKAFNQWYTQVQDKLKNGRL